jgi:hypothetical protein
MTNEILEYMNLKLKELLPYQYYEWSTKVVYPYWIGEYSEIPSNAEDGFGEDTMMITGTTKGSVIDLENGKEILRKAFSTIKGYHAVLDSGTHILVFYDTATSIPTDGNDIKRLQVNLQIKSWKVNE